MLQMLANHNDDVRRLIHRGFAITIDSNYLVVRDIPYLDNNGNLNWGVIVTKMVLKTPQLIGLDSHQVFFSGSSPYGLDGKPIPNIGDSPTKLALSKHSSDFEIQRQFSYKLKASGSPRAYKDFYEKIETYVAVISGPAIEKFNVKPYTFRVVSEEVSASPFKFQDTLTSRAQINDLSKKFENEVVAIIGLGGTGAHVLDLIAKTPVKEIRIFDGDDFHVHNSYRSPGSTNSSEFNKKKAEVYQKRYETFRDGIVSFTKYVDSSCADDLTGVTFAFVCVDKGTAREEIFNLLLSLKIPFIDVGMGLKRKDEKLVGDLRVTHFSAEEGQKTKDKKLAPTTDNPDDIYKTNIQIGETNSFNACMAVLKYKQLIGFFKAEETFTNLVFRIGDLKMIGEE